MEKINLNGEVINFKLDTGVVGTAITEKYFKQRDGSLVRTTKRLYGPGHYLLDVIGCFNSKLIAKRPQHGTRVVHCSRTDTTTPKHASHRGPTVIAQNQRSDTARDHLHRRLSIHLSRTGKTPRVRQDKAQRWNIKQCSFNTMTCSAPHERKSIWRAGQDKEHGCHNQSDRAQKMVLRNGGCPESKWRHQSVCWPHTPEWISDKRALAMLTNAKVFMKLDARSGFLQSPTHYLHHTVWGVPLQQIAIWHFIGTWASSEMNVWNVWNVCHADVILVFGRDRQEHDKRLHKVQLEGLTLNERCKFAKDEIIFLGHRTGARSQQGQGNQGDAGAYMCSGCSPTVGHGEQPC